MFVCMCICIFAASLGSRSIAVAVIMLNTSIIIIIIVILTIIIITISFTHPQALDQVSERLSCFPWQGQQASNQLSPAMGQQTAMRRTRPLTS